MLQSFPPIPALRRALRRLMFASLFAGSIAGTPSQIQAAPIEIVLVDPETVTLAAVSQWKKDLFSAVAVLLDERTAKPAYTEVARRISDGGLDLYWWVEVARNPKLAAAHPEWMAALGSHKDWQRSFPNFPEPAFDEVAKAFPWVPISYRESFDAHVDRVEQLLKRVPSGWRGLLLNDLQGGPSSCGCGNLQCRWAIDYHVRATAIPLGGDDVAARFMTEIRRRAGDKSVIPVWTTECAEVDLPSEKNQGRPGTGLCGTVGCTSGACPEVFTRQWSALTAGHNGPIGLLAVHTALQRTQKQFGGGPGWVTNAIAYLDRTVPAHGGNAISSQRLWVVVEGSNGPDETTARELALKAGVGGIIVARTRMDQSYEPRIVRVK